MGKFRTALDKGLEAHKRLMAAQQDLREVLAEAAADLREMESWKDINFEFGQTSKAVKGRLTRIEVLAGMVAEQQHVTYTALWGINAQKRVEFGEVEFSSSGYPIAFKAEGAYATARDKAGLASAIQELFASRPVAVALARLQFSAEADSPPPAT